MPNRGSTVQLAFNNWKLPGGQVEPQEWLQKAVEREVWEETGIKTEFEGILGMRELKDFRYNKGDMYYICLLRALTTKIEI